MSWPPTLRRTSELTATRIWSLLQLERQLRPEAYGRRRGGYLERRPTPDRQSQANKAPVRLSELSPWPPRRRPAWRLGNADGEHGVHHSTRRLPKPAAVVGTWNRSLGMTSSTTPDARFRPSRILAHLVVFYTAPSRWP
jgi:hypothetical protein